MTSGLSVRGRHLVEAPPLPQYVHEHFARMAEPPDPLGAGPYLPLCIAENKLTWDLLEPKIAECRTIRPEAIAYGPWIGSLEFREGLASFLGRTFMDRQLGAENIAVLAGAGSVLESLFYVICDPGDGVLVPTPSYAGFWADFETRDQLTIIPVHGSSADQFRLTPELLDAAYDTADSPIRALLITSPNNPLGSVYSQTELEQVHHWAEAKDIHVVYDEIYALSAYGSTPFLSAASLRPQLGMKTHIIWGFSKDFAMSGLRCGVLVTENQAVLEAVEGIAYWASVSGDTQALLAAMISDETWVDDYIAENRRRLLNSYSIVASALENAGIPFLDAQAGFFIMCDMRQFMSEVSWQAEDELWRLLLDGANVNLTPGSACRVAEPGFMRLCFAGMPPEDVAEGIGRIHHVLTR